MGEELGRIRTQDKERGQRIPGEDIRGKGILRGGKLRYCFGKGRNLLIMQRGGRILRRFTMLSSLALIAVTESACGEVSTEKGERTMCQVALTQKTRVTLG